jgi:hypothetical protein
MRNPIAEDVRNAGLLRDVTADYSDEHMHAALDVNIPSYTSAIVTSTEGVASLSAVLAV